MSSNSKPKFLFAAGARVVTAAAAGIVILAALTTWWALFALLALCPLMMLVCGGAMMSAMDGRMGLGFCAGGPCSSWRQLDPGAPTTD
jgi:hypothetical protein